MCCANGFDSDYILICHEGNSQTKRIKRSYYFKGKKRILSLLLNIQNIKNLNNLSTQSCLQ